MRKNFSSFPAFIPSGFDFMVRRDGRSPVDMGSQTMGMP